MYPPWHLQPVVHALAHAVRAVTGHLQAAGLALTRPQQLLCLLSFLPGLWQGYPSSSLQESSERLFPSAPSALPLPPPALFTFRAAARAPAPQRDAPMWVPAPRPPPRLQSVCVVDGRQTLGPCFDRLHLFY